MKTKLIFSTIISFTFCLLSSQVPMGFNYQSIARSSAGKEIINTNLQVQISILSDTTGFYAAGAGTYVWEEQQNVTTNNFGLFTLVLGSPSASKIQGSSASFSAIDWKGSPLYIGTKIYYQGSWKPLGSAKLWTVPYSMVSGSLAGPVTKLAVTGETSLMDEALFEVKNKSGQTVFAVYNEGVRVYVDDGIAKGATKGGFAIGGFGTVKTPGQEYFRVTKDSTRVYLNNTGAKSTKGGFAIGGFNQVKTGNEEYLRVTRDSTRIYINDIGAKSTKGGFAIGGFDQVKGKNLEYLRITSDSARINIKEAVKGTKGGFAIGGFDQVKGSITPFTSLTPENYFIGHEAGMSNTTGLFNSFFGYKVGRLNTTGTYNVFIGPYSGASNKDGWANLFIGDSAGYENTSGYYNVSLGAWAGQWNKSGRFNVLLGANAGLFNVTGNQNVNIGMQAGAQNKSGSYNTIIGSGAGQNATIGSYNVFLGNISGYNANSGDGNVYLGSFAGRDNISGNWNVFIGYNAGRNETLSQRLYISNSATTQPLIFGEFDNGRVVINGNSTNNYSGRTLFVNGPAGGNYPWYNDSDKKLKHDIVTIPDALQKVLKMRGVNFLWNQPAEGMDGLQMGFIGQEAANIVPEVVSVNNDHYSMQYAPVTALLVEAMKEQQKQIDNQKKEIDELKTLVNTLIANQISKGNN